MKIRNIAGCLLLLLALAACATTKNKTSSLLWRISGNGLESPSYLFGTHHLIPLSILDSIPGLHEAFDKTEQTVGELDMSRMNEMQAVIMGAAIMPDGYDYRSLTSESDFRLIDKMLKEYTGMGLEQLDRMKPAMLKNLIIVTLYHKYYPTLSEEISIDQYFQEEAARRSRPVRSLETAEEQAHLLLESQSIERQVELLVCLVHHPEMLKAEIDRLQSAYMAQDLHALNTIYEEELPDDPCPSTPEEKRAINQDRNERWLSLLPDMMQEKPSFIAVGCLHLVGKEGLIEGLRKLGYRVDPVK
ncbi:MULTISPECIES: TraB/GumN family protein [Petrimonas]|jgi:uncharacterized protein YbaP (TraB family)|uniref:TraB/GumN family protein n=2 Tax=Petrimonas mucosa TaxID=1642646 RepID=A0A1G4G480_9BACT|nr:MULTISPECIES: TraB/GumN family protein [Petrimonas]SCM55676.1 putative protein {ECO:0000313/EMBL:CEA17073,1} [Petrimonas mucosa]SFU68736.1 hypothetical protein SAMN05216364_10669 [Porphyromonadaceae bacterium KHP3R9]